MERENSIESDGIAYKESENCLHMKMENNAGGKVLTVPVFVTYYTSSKQLKYSTSNRIFMHNKLLYRHILFTYRIKPDEL